MFPLKYWFLGVFFTVIVIVSFFLLGIPSAPPAPEGTIVTREVLNNPELYNGQVVSVFGKVTDLGSGDSQFMLDDKRLTVFYIWHVERETINITSQVEGVIANGDYVVVTGRFIYSPLWTPTYRLNAENLEKSE